MKNKPVKTNITKISADQILIRGFSIERLMREHSFSDVIFLLLNERLPTEAEAELFNAILVSCVDHGVDAPSVHVTRTTASCGVPVQTAIASGVNAIGEFHGGAGEACAKLLQDALKDHQGKEVAVIANDIVNDYLQHGSRIPGFGHRMHNPDMRAVVLFEMAQKLQLNGPHLRLLESIQTALAASRGKELPINVDGAIAALISDMGFDWRFGKSLFVISRVTGLAAHAHEQAVTGKPLSFAQPVPVEFNE